MLHLTGAIALMLGLLLQVTQYNQALAAPQNQGVESLAYQDSDEIVPAPVQVVVLGDFQTQIGCGSFDLNCGASQLQNQGGLWTGSIPIPPGNYNYQIGAIGADGGQYVFGQGGLNGDTDNIDIDDGQAGAFFSFNASTYEIQAEALDALFVLNTDFGTLPLGPDGGDLSAIVFAQSGGSLNLQLLINGEPAGDPQSVNLDPGPNRITISTDGSVQDVESLGYATLTITRLDNGQPAAGGCYQVRDGDVVSQGCDIDDGSADGNTSIFFAEGLDSGGYDLQEVITPQGIDTADDQEIQLENDNNSVEIQTGGGEVLEPTEEGEDPLTPSDDGDGEDGEVLPPTEEDGDIVIEGDDEETPEEDQQAGPGDLIVTLEDGEGNPIAAACFQLLDETGNVVTDSCDTAEAGDGNPDNGNTGFFGVPSGAYTLRQSEAPDETELAEDQQVEVTEGESTNVTVTVDVASPVPTETPETPEGAEEQVGDVVIIRQDQDGNPVGGACFVIFDQEGNQATDEVCDEDGDVADDGRTGFFGLPAGTYFLLETQTPENVEPAADQQIEVQADQATDLEVRTNLIEVDQPEEETPTVETVEPTEADVTPTEEDQEAGPGDLIVTLQDDNGQPIGGACFQLLNDTGDVIADACDTDDDFPNNGNSGFFGVPSGTYTLHQSESPEGTETAADQQVDVSEGQSTTFVVTAVVASPEPTETPEIPEATEQTEEQVGDFVVIRQDQDGNPLGGACFIIFDQEGNQIADEVCDEDGDIADDGRTGFFGLPAGTIFLRESRTPDNVEPAEDRQIEIQADQSTELEVRTNLIEVDQPEEETPTEETVEPTEETAETPTEDDAPDDGEAASGPPGDLIVTLQDENGQPIGGACFELLNPDGSSAIESCDINDDFPNNGNSGFFGVPSGNYTLHQSEVPEGFQPVEDQPITVDFGQSRTDIIQTSAVAEDEAQPTEEELEPTATESDVSAAGDGIVRIDLTAFGGEGDAICVELNTAGTIGISDPPGACDNEEGDVNGDDGIIELGGVPSGEYQIQITQGPDEALNAEPLAITVAEDGSGEAIFAVAAPEVGSLRISLVDDQGNPIAIDGGCVRVEELDVEVCDNGDPDTDPETGSILLADVQFGTYTIFGTVSPDGYVVPEIAATAEVNSADEPASITIQFVAEGPQTGTITINVVDNANDQPIAAGCFDVANDSGTFNFCDDDADGTIQVPDVAFGAQTVTQTSATDGYAIDPEAQQIELTEDQPEATTSFRNGINTGSIAISLLDSDNAPIASEGGCVRIEELDREICDNGDGDTDPVIGSILVEQVPFGTYTITGGTAPEGFDIVDQAGSATVESSDQPASATVQFALQGPATGTITITVVDDANDQPIAAGCFDVANDSGVFNFCDEDSDGTIQVPDVAFGAQTVTQTSAADGYAVDPEAQQFELNQDSPEATVTFRNAQSNGSISVVATDNNDQPIGGACWSLTGANGEFGPICDDESNGGIANDGEVTFSGVPAGTYSIVETTPPSGYGLAEPRDVEIAPGENAPVRVPHTQAVLTVTVSTSDGAGFVPTGACYAIDGGEPICDQDGDGIVNFENVAPGPHRFEQTTPPAGYAPVEGQDVEIIPGEVESVVFTNNQALNGSLLISVNDPEGNPVGDVCATIAEGQTICDGVIGDDADANGQILVSDLEPGDYSVTLSNLPQTLTAPAEATPVTVTSGEQATLQIDLVAAEGQTGTVEISLENVGGDAVDGGCVQLTDSAAGVELGPFCDNGEEDTNPDPGVVTLEGVELGTYLVSVPTEDGTGGGEFAAASTSSTRTIQVQANVIVVVVIIVIGQPLDGSLQINTRDANTQQLLGGACYDVTRGNQTISVCDNDDSDANGVNGVIRIYDLFVEGTYSIELSNEIPGYSQETVPEVEIESGQLTTVNVDLVPVAQSGTVIVNKVDGNGDPLGNSCFALRVSGVNVAEVCDSNDGEPNDGQLIFADVPTGTYRLVETRTPSADYQTAPSRLIDVVAGQATELTIVNTARPADLVVRKVDSGSTSTLLPGACFSLQNGSGDVVYGSFCDGDDRHSDGRIRFDDVVPGNYVLVEDVAPYGYFRADSREITIQPGVTQVVTVQDQRLPPPEETGALVVYKEDGSNRDLPGACFRLYDGNTPLTNTVCDGTDGSNDGTIRFASVPIGTWEIRETVTPSDAYVAAAPQDVEIENDETTELTVANQLKTGRIRIEKSNTSGAPLQNACFDVLEDSAGQACTNAAGEVVFDNLPPGSYTLRETQAPYGYVTVRDKSGIVVHAGRTSVVEVVNQRIPPDPDLGSVQVLKFYCPAGESGERTVFLGGVAGNAELAKTVGCEQGNAQFDLTQDDGSGGPGVFTTGNDGRYQVSVPSGTYSLEEIDPDLEGNSSVDLVVYRNQLTTVVVINYLEPPEPDPITVNIMKWTCDPSFNGTLYDDFAQNCTSETQLTNNITFRAQGPTNQKHVTGDGGNVGQTSFTDLTEGDYTIFEEKPYDIPTSYGFCGYDASWPADYKTVNGAFNLNLDWGDTVTCHFFNIPEDVTDTTGVVLVRKFICNIDGPTKGYDWFEECGLSNENAKFALNSYNAEMQQFQEFSQGTANDDGFLRFTNLRPGTYELKEIDGTWCHAESDSVDSNGDVVIKANEVSTVWIFNCVPTKSPPNTGSGDAAGSLDPRNGEPEDGGRAPVVTPAISIGWPIVFAAAWLTWRKVRTMPELRPVRLRVPVDRVDRHRRAG